ncbi:MAG TPA: response regulator, partial [Anaerolineales bacterium]|nr:response regulator [Anaerolineales bacterium]
DLRSYIADELSDDGHQVDTAADGVEAVMRVIDGGVDAVVMDIRMPRLDGLNALRILRRLSPSLPVVMFTGQAGQGDMLETTRLGAVTCLLKPVNIDRLKEILVQSVNRKKIAA